MFKISYHNELLGKTVVEGGFASVRDAKLWLGKVDRRGTGVVLF